MLLLLQFLFRSKQKQFGFQYNESPGKYALFFFFGLLRLFIDFPFFPPVIITICLKKKEQTSAIYPQHVSTFDICFRFEDGKRRIELKQLKLKLLVIRRIIISTPRFCFFHFKAVIFCVSVFVNYFRPSDNM